MKLLRAAFAAGVTVVLLTPLAAAQQSGRVEPVQACRPVECVPLEANGGQRAIPPVHVILFAHCAEILSRCPVNTQEPDSSYVNLSHGAIMPTVVTRLPGPCGTTNVCWVNNWFHWESADGLVERTRDGKLRVPHWGTAGDVVIASDVVWLYAYFSVTPLPADGPGAAAGVDALSNVGVYGRIETGRFPFDGAVVAEGDSGVYAIVAGAYSVGRAGLVGLDPDGRRVYEFKVPLRVQSRTIASAETGSGFVVSINLYQLRQDGASPDQGFQFAQSDWRFVATPNLPPRLAFELANPFLVPQASAGRAGATLHFTWEVLTPFGQYDVDQSTVRGELVAVDGSIVGQSEFVESKPVLAHTHRQPVTFRWRFDTAVHPLPDGEYTFRMSVQNRQGTYLITDEVPIVINQGIADVPERPTGKTYQGRDVPAAAAPLLVGLLVLGPTVRNRLRSRATDAEG